MCLRIPIHIPIRIHPLRITLRCICRKEHSHSRVIVSRIIVIQPGERIIILPRKRFGRVNCSGQIARCASDAVGAEELVAFDGGAVSDVAEGGDDAAQHVGQVEDSVGAIERADQSPAEEVVVQVACADSRAGVGMFFQPEGVGRNGCRRAVRWAGSAAAQDAIAVGVVDVLLLLCLAGGIGRPVRHAVELVVVHGVRDVGGRARGDVAKGVIAAGIDGPAQVGASGAGRVEASQIVRLAVAIQVQIIATACQGTLRDLTQVGVREAVAIGSDAA